VFREHYNFSERDVRRAVQEMRSEGVEFDVATKLAHAVGARLESER
jgi:hypothetical protein